MSAAEIGRRFSAEIIGKSNDTYWFRTSDCLADGPELLGRVADALLASHGAGDSFEAVMRASVAEQDLRERAKTDARISVEILGWDKRAVRQGRTVADDTACDYDGRNVYEEGPYRELPDISSMSAEEVAAYDPCHPTTPFCQQVIYEFRGNRN